MEVHYSWTVEMPLDTQSFGFKRDWLATALQRLPIDSDIFSKAQLSEARKAFLAGSNQLSAIKNWLINAGIIEIGRGLCRLTELGEIMAAKDERAEDAWTWWLLHLHLCANSDSGPYSSFFTTYDPGGTAWMPVKDVQERLGSRMAEDGNAVAPKTVETYFAGVQQAFRVGWPLHDLRLMEHREIVGEQGGWRIRRCITKPHDVVVAYTTLLFRESFYPNKSTIEARVLLERGVAKALGIRDASYRDALSRIHQDSKLSGFLEYRRAVNLDSVQFPKMGSSAVRQLRAYVYGLREVQWP